MRWLLAALGLLALPATAQPGPPPSGGGSSYTLPAATASTLGGVMPDGTSITNSAGAISVPYGTTANTAAQGNDSRITGAYAASNPSGYQTAANVTSSVNTALPSVATTTPLCGTG